MQEHSVARRIRLAGAETLHRMIQRADTGGEKDPQRRVDRGRRIEHDNGRRHLRVTIAFLHVSACVGAACARVELARRKRGRNRDLLDARPLEIRRFAAVTHRARAEGVEAFGLVDLMLQTQPHDLAAISKRAATERDDEIGPGGARRVRRLDHCIARRMGRHRIVKAGIAIAECRAHFLHFVGRPVHRAARHQEHAPRIHAVRFGACTLRGRTSVHHPLEVREYECALIAWLSCAHFGSPQAFMYQPPFT